MEVKMQEMDRYALITGASQGLGRAFALELAGRGIHTILVSLPNEELGALNQEIITTYGVDSQYFEMDLADTEALLSFADQINETFEVFLLINNAGIGGTMKFDQIQTEDMIDIIQVNVMALSVLTHRLLPNLLRQAKGYILNVSSISACTPIGFKTVYPASKAFVYSFSLGLSEELRNTSVSVSVVNPGPMLTNSKGRARFEKHGCIAKMIRLEPDKVAKYSITHVLKGDRVIRVNFWSWEILRHLPVWMKLPLLTNAVRKEIEQ